MKLRNVCLMFIAAIGLGLPEARAALPSRGIGWQTDFAAACRQATSQQRPLLVMVTAPWCGYCRKMFQETFIDGNVAKQINNGFVPVIVDTDVNSRVSEALGVQSLPTTLVLSPDRAILRTLTGFQSAGQLQASLAPYAASPLVAAASVPRSSPSQPSRQGIVNWGAQRQSFVDKYVRRENQTRVVTRPQPPLPWNNWRPTVAKTNSRRLSFVEKYVKTAATPPTFTNQNAAPQFIGDAFALRH